MPTCLSHKLRIHCNTVPTFYCLISTYLFDNGTNVACAGVWFTASLCE